MFWDVHLNITRSLILPVMSPKRWKVYALCFCSLWRFICCYLWAFLSCSTHGLLTITGWWASQQPADPPPSWPRLSCLQRYQNTSATHRLALSKDELFSPVRVSWLTALLLWGPLEPLSPDLPPCRPPEAEILILPLLCHPFKPFHRPLGRKIVFPCTLLDSPLGTL